LFCSNCIDDWLKKNAYFSYHHLETAQIAAVTILRSCPVEPLKKFTTDSRSSVKSAIKLSVWVISKHTKKPAAKLDVGTSKTAPTLKIPSTNSQSPAAHNDANFS
jgi:hypothetical protein